MDHSAGLDVSVKQTSVCIVDDTGRIVREVKVASEPEALLANPAYHFKRIGLEAGPLSQSAAVGNSVENDTNRMSCVIGKMRVLQIPRKRHRDAVTVAGDRPTGE
jgi:predicted NBD/HSP70 family sugar kinase